MVAGCPEVLALIPARGGSKSLPRKNILPLGGVPLVAWVITAALEAPAVTRVLVSTDDAEIADVARQFGAEVPFLRPPELARDDTLDWPVFDHVLRWLEGEERYAPELVVHLRPTTPFVRPEDIQRGVELLARTPEADSVRMVSPPLQNPFKMWQVGAEGFLVPLIPLSIPEPYNQPRQKLPPVLWQNGVDLTRRRTVLELRSMTGQRILPLTSSAAGWETWIDIDTAASLDVAECLLRTGKVGVRPPRRWERTSGSAMPARRRTPPKEVRLLVLDFDGVMTDNRVLVSANGDEMVAVNRSDGLGLAALREGGIHVVVLSAETNPVVEARCRKLQIPCYSGMKEKRLKLLELLADRGVPPGDVIYAGNDVNDLGCMELVGFSVAVQDAHPTVLERADLVLSRPGGRGAVRELCDWLLELVRQKTACLG